ncbi:pentapeptide repeat-containing protein [Nakamurella deserti]|uniref:pentapeptide repeat-containing protein n=1 Tax=Nakamurella deserti TaxID=2164074 RepID=UPI000DBE1AED|nr:pentapeptide repeat-containing protein [Nakamurella deserti]
MPAWAPGPAVTALADLPYARALTAQDRDPLDGDDHEHASWEGGSWDRVDAGGTRFADTAVSGMTVTGGDFGRSRWHDSWIGRSRWIGTDLTQVDLRDVTVVGCALTATGMSGATWRRVHLVECRIESVNLKFATLTDVLFDRCELTDVDFGGLKATRVRFPGSTVSRLRLNDTTLTDVDFRGARSLDVTGDVTSLRGAVVDAAQLADLAPALAVGLGLRVE